VASFTISRKVLSSFLGSFTKGTDNLAIRVGENNITVAVGALTHYLKRSVEVQESDAGKIFITDLTRLMTYLGTASASDVTVSQSGRGRALQVRAGKSSLELPTSSFVASEEQVPLIEKVIAKSESSMWTSFGPASLEASGNISGVDLYGLSKADKIVGSGLSCKVVYRPRDNELALMAKNTNKGKMFATAEVEAVSGVKESYESNFAHWLPELLTTVPDTVVQFHMGESAPLVIRDQDGSYLLLVFDQEVEA